MRVLLAICATAFLLTACGDDDDDVVAADAALADAGPEVCVYEGMTYDDGEVFPASDGCNSCKCNPTGQTPGEYGCSLLACVEDAGPDASR